MNRNIIQVEKTRRSILKKQELLTQIELNEIENGVVIYPNQNLTAKQVVENFKKPEIITQMVIAETQVGKTGIKLAIIQEMVGQNITEIDNIYIITGLSSIDWKNQINNRFPETLHRRIFHSPELTKSFVENIKNKHNVLVLMDEIQTASKPNQRVYKCFKEAGFYDKQFLLDKDVKIVEFSATPDGTIYDLMRWKEHQMLVRAYPAETYVGCYDLLQKKKVKQFKDLECLDVKTGKVKYDIFNKNVESLMNDIQNFKKPKYHIIRTPNGDRQKTVASNLKTKFPESEYNYITFDRESDVSNIGDLLKKRPSKHTFILIKEKLRCSITYPTKEFLGISYERYTQKVDDAVIIQSLLGRLTGYTTCHYNICYTNIHSIIKYKQLIDSNFEDKSVKWNSSTTKRIRGILSTKDTFNSVKFVKNFDDSSSTTSNDSLDNDIEIIYFDTQEELIEYHKTKYKTTLQLKQVSSDGFIYSYWRNNYLKLPLSNIENNPHIGLGRGHTFRWYACYEDVEDNTTLKFVAIYRKSL